MAKYFYVELRYRVPRKTSSGSELNCSGHIIRAEDQGEAIRIVAEHGISTPMGTPASNIERADVREIDPSLEHARRWLGERRRGLGGRIWCEDEDGELCCEVEEGDELYEWG